MKKVRPGDKLSIRATDWNAVQEQLRVPVQFGRSAVQPATIFAVLTEEIDSGKYAWQRVLLASDNSYEATNYEGDDAHPAFGPSGLQGRMVLLVRTDDWRAWWVVACLSFNEIDVITDLCVDESGTTGGGGQQSPESDGEEPPPEGGGEEPPPPVFPLNDPPCGDCGSRVLLGATVSIGGPAPPFCNSSWLGTWPLSKVSACEFMSSSPPIQLTVASGQITVIIGSSMDPCRAVYSAGVGSECCGSHVLSLQSGPNWGVVTCNITCESSGDPGDPGDPGGPGGSEPAAIYVRKQRVMAVTLSQPYCLPAPTDGCCLEAEGFYGASRGQAGFDCDCASDSAWIQALLRIHPWPKMRIVNRQLWKNFVQAGWCQDAPPSQYYNPDVASNWYSGSLESMRQSAFNFAMTWGYCGCQRGFIGGESSTSDSCGNAPPYSILRLNCVMNVTGSQPTFHRYACSMCGDFGVAEACSWDTCRAGWRVQDGKTSIRVNMYIDAGYSLDLTIGSWAIYYIEVNDTICDFDYVIIPLKVAKACLVMNGSVQEITPWWSWPSRIRLEKVS